MADKSHIPSHAAIMPAVMEAEWQWMTALLNFVRIWHSADTYSSQCWYLDIV